MGEQNGARAGGISVPDELEAGIHKDIRDYGWSGISVLGDEQGPPWTYSIGIYHSFAHPEIVIFGLSHEVIHAMIWNVVNAVKAGHHLEDGDESSDILQGYNCSFHIVDRAWYKDYFGRALDFYGGSDFPILQCVWPDKNGLYPWQEGFNEGLRAAQPLLFKVN